MMKKEKRSLLLTALIFISLLVLTATSGILRVEAQSTVTHTCYFYGAAGQLLSSVEVAEGDTLAPVSAPAISGMKFSHWYQVDASLQGDPEFDYAFGTPVREPVYLRAYYEAMPQATVTLTPLPTETPPAEDQPADQPTPDEPALEETATATPPAEEPAPETSPVPEEGTDPTATPPTEEPTPETSPTPTEEAETVEPAPETSPAPEEDEGALLIKELEAEESEAEAPVLEDAETEEPEDEAPALEEAEAEEPEGEEPRVFLKEEIDAMNPNRKISFYASWDSGKTAPELGDQVTLHVELSGYEGLIYKIRWQVKQSGDWQDLDSYGASYTLTLTEENLDWLFRVAVDITNVELD